MIKARHTFSGKLLADFCSGPYMQRYFRRVDLIGRPDDSDGVPLLMLANHFSWWDGFIQYRLNKSVFGRRLHVMMLEEQLQRHMIMNRCGCFSVRKNSRSLLETMRYTLDLLAEPRNMVLIFPQGELGSMHRRPVSFQSGPEYILNHLKGDYRIVFNVNLPDYGPFKKPALNIYYKTFDPHRFASPGDLEREYNDYFNRCVADQCM